MSIYSSSAFSDLSHSSSADTEAPLGELGQAPVVHPVQEVSDFERADRLAALPPERPSLWSVCGWKRLFDLMCVLLALPLVLPLLLGIALLVRITSDGPVFFLQKRVGRHGRQFTILKFRTMKHLAQGRHRAVTTAGNQPFTPIGPFLRRWKLDELPQLFNVLIGDMSMVGPRPKLPEHRVADLDCHPGITGAATIAFAREEAILARVPGHHLDDFYREIVLPAKLRLDQEYMARATFSSDFKLLLDTVLRRWDRSILGSLLESVGFGESGKAALNSPIMPAVKAGGDSMTQEEQLLEVQGVS